jgi:hypothetical protein
MKRIIFIATILILSVPGFSQTDTTKPNEPDTIKVGNFIIIKKDKKTNSYDTAKKSNEEVLINIGSSETSSSYHYHHRIVSTNWLIFDLGFANWRDKTNYGSAEANAYLTPFNGHSFTSDDLDLKNVKSTNVNMWFFMQRLSVVKDVLNLKYGLGLQMYNYRYETNISYKKSPPSIQMDTIDFSKNKLAADYVTIPFMININPYPHRHEGFSLSFGISAGYLYSSRNKQVSDERGKQKTKGDFDLDPWRFAYVGEIGLGPVRVYGSYSINNLYKHGVKQYPYAVGLRFSNW